MHRAGSPFKRGDSDDDDGAGDDIDDSIVPHMTKSPAPQPGIDEPRVIGSNNWVVSGAHTVSGKPLLSNDMHLGHQVPNLWYEAHLRFGKFDVAGVTLPGMPYVIVGHNQRIAWGFTNIGPTVEDVVIEKQSGDGEFLTPDGWKPAEHRREVIHVRDKPNVVLDVVASRHGPIIAELIPERPARLLCAGLFTTAREIHFLIWTRHRTGTSFERRFPTWTRPGQNVVYADVDGNIGYQATGKIPIRATGDGSLPQSRRGCIQRLDRVHCIRCFAARLQSASWSHRHGKQPNYSSDISHLSVPDGKLRGGPTESTRSSNRAASFLRPTCWLCRTDIYSDFDHLVAERLARAVDASASQVASATEAAETLRAWDGRMSGRFGRRSNASLKARSRVNAPSARAQIGTVDSKAAARGL